MTTKQGPNPLTKLLDFDAGGSLPTPGTDDLDGFPTTWGALALLLLAVGGFCVGTIALIYLLDWAVGR